MKSLWSIAKLEIFIGLAGLLAVALVWYTDRLTAGIERHDHPLSESMRNIVQDVAIGHVWLEEALTGDTSVDRERQALGPNLRAAEQCRDLLALMPSLRRSYADTLQTPLQTVCARAEAIAVLARVRLETTGSRPGDTLDQRYDALVMQLMDAADQVNHLVRAGLEEDHRSIDAINRVVAAGLLALFLLMGIVVLRANRAIAAKNIQLDESLTRHKAIVDNIADGILTLEPGGRIESANPAAERIFGYAAGGLSGLGIGALIPELQTDPGRRLSACLAEAGGAGHTGEITGHRQGGEAFALAFNLAGMDWRGARVLVAVVRDLSAQKREQAENVRLARHIRLLLDSTTEGIYGMNSQGRCTFINAAGARMLGYRPDEVIGQEMHALIHHSHADGSVYTHQDCIISHAWREGRTHRVSNEVFWRANGSHFPIEYTASPIMQDSELKGMVVTFADITERKQTEQRLSFLLNHDSLTGLPNRVLFRDRLRQAAKRVRRNGRLLALLFIDLDNFKQINDTLGHAMGDRLLNDVVGRLKGGLRETDSAARFGGDEFTILLEGLRDEDEASAITQQLLDSFAHPFQLEGHEIYLTISIGITLYPADDTDLDNLMRNAYTATYRAKELGRNNFQFYTADMNSRALERLSMESHLRHALARKEFLVYFQPQIDLRTGRVAGMECLLRWVHPELGMVSPVQFIPLLEQNGLIIPVGEWVLRAACTQARAWLTDPALPPMTIAVNLSARQFAQRNLVSRVAAILEETGLPADRLDLELTESIIMENAPATVATLGDLKALGIRISVDDFGTGYSSLSYLKRFPIDVLKIDQSFVREIPGDEDDAAIATAIVNMAHGLGIKVIAEGVETVDQIEFLRARGCDGIQGYYYSKPLPPDEIANVVRTRPLLRVGSGRD